MFILIPVFISEDSVAGDVEQNDGKGSGPSRNVRRNVTRTNDF